MKDEDKQRIDNMSYEQLLRHWRFGSVSDNIFEGETGEYYSKVMSRKKNALSIAEQVQISKRIGWNA